MEVERLKGCSATSRKGAMFKLTLNFLPTGNDGVLFTSGSFLLLSQDIIENVKNMSIRFQCFVAWGLYCLFRGQIYCY